MAQVILPAEHARADAELAGRLAKRLSLAELYVFWTASPRSRPAQSRGEAGRGTPRRRAEPLEPAPQGPAEQEAPLLTAGLAALGWLLQRLGERLGEQRARARRP